MPNTATCEKDMDFNNIDDIKSKGFKGFKTIRDLWTDKSDIPDIKGVYLLLTPTPDRPTFINPGVGGYFKGKDPNLPIDQLKDNWVTGSQVVYIGKAGSLTGQSTLKKRIKQYLRFGQGKNVGHWGGRLIWQLTNHPDLTFCWQTTNGQNPRDVERTLINDFVQQFGSRPFANLTN